MRRAFAWIGGIFGAAALLRLLRRRREPDLWAPSAPPAEDTPEAELRRKLAEAREAADDRDEYDAAEGVPLDQAEPDATRGYGVDERRRAVHERAEATLEEMRADDGSDSS